MKIEKFPVPNIEPNTATGLVLKEMCKKFNEIIDAMTCPQCGNIKGMVGPGMCFPCDQKEQLEK